MGNCYRTSNWKYKFKKSKKGFALLDIVISLALLMIIYSILLPVMINSLNNRENLNNKIKIYRIFKNQMEIISSASYSGEENYDIIIPDKYEYKIKEEKLSGDLKKYTIIIIDDKGRENKIEKILQVKRLYPN